MKQIYLTVTLLILVYSSAFSQTIAYSSGATTPTPEELYWYEYRPPDGQNVNGCNFNWLPTNGQAVVTTSDGASPGSLFNQKVYLKWLNHILNDGSNVYVSVSLTGCNTTSLNGTKPLNVNPKYLPAPTFKTAGGSTITTLNVPCYTPEITLRLEAIPDAEYYRWELPAGWSKKGSPGVNLFSTSTPTVEVTVGEGVTSTSIKAYTSIASFNGPSTTLPVTRNADPVSISSNPLVYCSSIKPVTYQTTNIPGLTYTWTYPSGWSCQSGCNASTITLIPDGSDVQGQTVTARGSTTCASQTVQTNIASVTINFSTSVSPDFTVSGPSLVCNSSVQFTLSNVAPSAPTWTATPSNLFAVSSGSGSSVSLAANTYASGPGTLTYTIPGCSTPLFVSKPVWVGTQSPYYGGTFNDGGSGVNQPLGDTYNEVYNKTIYVSLSFPMSGSQYTWDGFYTNGNVTWYHPAGTGGLIINFGSPPPVYTGDYIGFSIHSTNACGTATEPLFFYYRGPNLYYRIAPNPVKSTFNIAQLSGGGPDKEALLNQEVLAQLKKNRSAMDLIKIQIIDKMGITVLEQDYPANTRSATIDTFGLAPDIYTVRLFTNDKVEVHKIVVQH